MADIDRCTSRSGIYKHLSVLVPKDGSHRLSWACVEFLTGEELRFHVMDSALPRTLRLNEDFHGLNYFAQENEVEFTCTWLLCPLLHFFRRVVSSFEANKVCFVCISEQACHLVE
jgi:hypothetical protein